MIKILIFSRCNLDCIWDHYSLECWQSRKVVEKVEILFWAVAALELSTDGKVDNE